MRGRRYSYSPSPPRGYGRRARSPSPRGHYGGRRDRPTSLLVRNLRRDCMNDELRKLFGRYGPIKDIYLPRDYHTGEPRGFGFVQFVDPDDAADAKHCMDGQMLRGRAITVVFAEENRKKPSEMKARERRLRSHDYRRSPRHSHSPRYSRSPSRSPRRNGRARPRSHSYSPSPKRRRLSRSASPQDKRSNTHSPMGNRSRSRSPAEDYRPSRASHRERSRSVSQ